MDAKKIILPLLLVGIISAFIAYRQFFSNPVPALNNNQTSAPRESINPGQTGDSSSVGVPTTQTSYKNGQYTGDVANTIYGDVQVRVTILNGKMTDIEILQYPNKAGHTRELSNEVLPILRSEAIKKQTSSVDIISGATQTSEGFLQSLASALIKAS